MVAALVMGLAPVPAWAEESLVIVRYRYAHEVGVGLGPGGGGYVGLDGAPQLWIPTWAKSATVRIVDDRHLPVAGTAQVYAADAPQWLDTPPSASHVICTRGARSFLVPAGGLMQLRIVAGVMTAPNEVVLTGADGPHRCAVAPSTPGTGVIRVTFHT
jgi:hypothetical protein